MGKQIDKIRVSAGEDLLAFIPHMLGYWPDRSIVCIGMNGKRLRATMRLDLPPEDMLDMSGFAAIAAAQMASDRESDGCLIAIFGPEDWDSPRDLPQMPLFQELSQAFARHRLPVQDAWFIGPRHWRSIDCQDGACCPWPGKDNASIKESFVNAEFVYRGSVVGESPEQQIRQLVAVQDQDFTRHVIEAGSTFRETLALAGAGAHQLAITLGIWEKALKEWPKPPDAERTAFLLATLAHKNVRDTVMVSLATEANAALSGAAGTGCLQPDTDNVVQPMNWYSENLVTGEEVSITDVSDEAIRKASRDFSNILVGEIANEDDATILGPDWSRLGRAELLLHFLASATATPDKAPVLCMLGWIEWCKGRGTWSGIYFRLCQELHPNYRLAALLDKLLAVGHVASCAKNPRTAWHGRRNPEPETLGQVA